jgi:hypothetical protein
LEKVGWAKDTFDSLDLNDSRALGSSFGVFLKKKNIIGPSFVGLPVTRQASASCSPRSAIVSVQHLPKITELLGSSLTRTR